MTGWLHEEPEAVALSALRVPLAHDDEIERDGLAMAGEPYRILADSSPSAGPFTPIKGAGARARRLPQRRLEHSPAFDVRRPERSAAEFRRETIHPMQAAPAVVDGDTAGLALVMNTSVRRAASGPTMEAPDVDDVEALLADADPTRTAAVAVEQGVARLGALGGGCIILADDGETLELTAAQGYPPEFVDAWRHFPLALPSPVSEAVRTGRPVYTEISPADDTGGRPRSGHGAVACMPLVSDGESLGVLMFTFEATWAPSRQEEMLLRALADVSARAVARAKRLRPARRIGRLESLMAALSTATAAPEIADAVLREGVASVGARAAAIGVVDAGRAHLKIVASHGYRRDVARVGARLPLDAALPLTVAARDGVNVVLESAAEVAAKYPALLPDFADWGDASLVALPLTINGTTIGAIRFTFDTPRLFDSEEQSFMHALAQLCAGAIDRAFYVTSHARAQRLQAMATALAHAGSPQEIAAQIVAVAASAFDASVVAVAVASGRRSLELLSTHGVPSELVDEWRTFLIDDSTPPGRIAIASEPLLLATRDEARAFDPWLAERLEQVDANAFVGIPLRGREEGTIGLLALAFASERRFDQEDVAFADELADLCAQALGRAAEVEGASALLQGFADAVVTVDADLCVRYANAEAARLFGADVGGETLPEPWPHLSLRDLVRGTLDGDGEAPPVKVRSDDATYEVEAMRSGDLAAIVVRDVSERELRQRAERDFVANAAHELRSPLAAIESALGALELGAKDEAWIRDRFISEIGAEVDRVNKLVRALLVLSQAQVQPGWLQLGRLELAPMLTEIASSLDVQPSVRVSCRCADDAAVRAEETLLAAALANLARNAARNTDQGTIVLSCGAAENGTRSIVVRDTGCGIAPDAIERVFDRYYRAPNAGGDGYGLGLAIVHEMVDALGGTIAVVSKPNAGTAVTITLEAA